MTMKGSGFFTRHPDESQGPALGGRKLDSGFRRNDNYGNVMRVPKFIRASPPLVTLTKVRVQLRSGKAVSEAFAGMTVEGSGTHLATFSHKGEKENRRGA